METPALRAIILIFGMLSNPFRLQNFIFQTSLSPYNLDYIGKHFPVNEKKENVFPN
jgi:hypothetical protein